MRDSSAAQIIAAARMSRAAGEKYKSTLEALYAYLSSAMLPDDYEEEKRRTKTLLETLERELDSMLPK